MQLYGLLGYPLIHSFSAAYFAQKFSREQLDAEYRNFEYADVNQGVKALLQHQHLRGFNVTIPHKQAIMPYLHYVSPEAQAIGAVNVVRVNRMPDGTPVLIGYNSDAVGFRESLVPLLNAEHRAALVLGTGGASRAVVYVLQQLGLDVLLVSRRSSDKTITYSDLTAEVMSAHLVVVNCTPLGTYPEVDTCADIPYHLLTPKHLLYDLVYNPVETRFMREGKKQGAVCKNGYEMLCLQAEAAWHYWQNSDVF